MTTTNDVTGDFIQSKTNSNTYRDNWDRIFAKGKSDGHDFSNVTLDATEASKNFKELTIKTHYFGDAENIFKDITGMSLIDVEHADDFVVYEMLVAIICIDFQDDKEKDLVLLECLKEVILYNLPEFKHEKFMTFLSEWMETNLDE